jgi:hypothetical protein
VYVVARARSEKTRLTGKCRRLAQISPSSCDSGLYSYDGFVEKKGGVDGGELVAADSPAIQRQWLCRGGVGKNSGARSYQRTALCANMKLGRSVGICIQ